LEARKKECTKCAKYDMINRSDEPDGRTVCCSCMRAHRDFSVCFRSGLRLDDSRFHFLMCNDCVHTFTVEAGSGSLLRTFKTLSILGVLGGKGGGRKDGATGD
ncbi:unnamed protein product, partial [Laminaria digitata]